MKYLEISVMPLLIGALPLGLLSGVHPALGCVGVAAQVAGVAAGLTFLAAYAASKGTRE